MARPKKLKKKKKGRDYVNVAYSDLFNGQIRYDYYDDPESEYQSAYYYYDDDVDNAKNGKGMKHWTVTKPVLQVLNAFVFRKSYCIY